MENRLGLSRVDDVVVAVGEIDASTASLLDAALDTAVADAPTGDVVLDLREVTFVDSLGLRVLVRVHRVLDDRDDRLVLRAPSVVVDRALGYAGLREHLHIEEAGGAVEAEDTGAGAGAAVTAVPLRLDLAADPALVRIVRLAAASLATDADFDVDELDDLKLALDELVTAAIRASDPSDRVELAFRADPSGVTVRGRCSVADLAIEEMAGALLDRAVDRWSVAEDPEGGSTFTIVKLRADVG